MSARVREARIRDAVIGAVRTLRGPDGRRVSVADYRRHREHHRALPAITTVYRIFGSWDEVIAAAAKPVGGLTRRRSSEPELVGALGLVAKALGVQVLSSHAYDGYRACHPELDLPSSSVIRKWMHSWEEAVERAGLQSPRRSGVRRVPMPEIIEAIRAAIEDVGPTLDTQSYEDWCLERVADGDDPPRLVHILQSYPSFEVAVRAADVERSDDLHPHALWTADEARRIRTNVETITGRRLAREDYEALRARARRPMPTWDTLQRLLHPPEERMDHRGAPA